LGIVEKCSKNHHEELMRVMLPQTFIKSTLIHSESFLLSNRDKKQNVAQKLRRMLLIEQTPEFVKSAYRQYFCNFFE